MTNNQDINWEERRFWASALILSGMCANYAHPSESSSRAKEAVWLADQLIHIITASSVSNNIKDNPQHTNQL